MKVLVIGATGLTGGIAVRRLLERGDEVTAFVRKPEGLAQKHERLRTAVGEARDEASILRAVTGQDAALSAFGPRSFGKDDLQEAYMRNLVAAMQQAGVKRLVNLSALGAGDSWPQMPFVGKIFATILLRNLFADKNRGEVCLFGSELDYVNVRPGRLFNGAARGGVKASLSAGDLKPALMTREDLAEFMVGQLQGEAWVRKSPIIGY